VTAFCAGPAFPGLPVDGYSKTPFREKCHKYFAALADEAGAESAPNCLRAAPHRCNAIGYGSPMSGSTHKAIRLGANFAATFILLLPALWNGFPFLEYDTGGYLARWFEGYLVPSRSSTYGLFLAAGWPLDFWPIIVLQALAAIWVIGLLLRLHRFNVYPIGLPAIVAALTVTTALPWLADVLLTDIFAGLAVLALHALVWHYDRLASRERAGLVLFTAFAASTHSATFAVLLALGAAALLLSWLNAKLVPRAGLAPMLAAMVLGAAMLLAANYAVSKTLAWTPGGYGIAFGRMLQDGIVTRYLNDHCPDEQLKLCPYRNSLPLDADDFLWDGDNSVFNKLGRFAGLGDEMRRIVLGSLRDYPLLQFKAAVVATARQLVAVATGEGIVTSMWHTYGIIERYTPSVAAAMHAARQQRGEVHFAALNAVHVPMALAGMALLPALLLGLWSADFADLGRLAATVALALFANAAFCGVISNPHDRYGSRLVWIATFAVALAAWRLCVIARAQPGLQARKCFDNLRPCAW